MQRAAGNQAESGSTNVNLTVPFRDFAAPHRELCPPEHRNSCYNAFMSTATILGRLLDPVASSLTPETAQQVVDFRADEQTQARIDELADRCNEGELTPEERREYDQYISAIDVVTVLQAKARSILEQHVAT